MVQFSGAIIKYEVHQSQYYQWRDQFLNQGAKVFASDAASKREEQMQKRIAKMQRVIGELTLELKKTIESEAQNQ